MNIGIMKFKQERHNEILDWISSFEDDDIEKSIKTWYKRGIYLFGLKSDKGFVAQFKKYKGYILDEFSKYEEYLSFPISFDLLEEVKLTEIDVEKNNGNEIYCEYINLPYYIYKRVKYIPNKKINVHHKICYSCDLCNYIYGKYLEKSIYDGNMSMGITLQRMVNAENTIERLPYCKKANMVYTMLPVSINIPIYDEFV